MRNHKNPADGAARQLAPTVTQLQLFDTYGVLERRLKIAELRSLLASAEARFKRDDAYRRTLRRLAIERGHKRDVNRPY